MTITESGQDKSALALYGGSPIRSAPWPTYDKGAVCIHEADEEAAIRAIRSRRYFRYDDRPYTKTETGILENKLCAYFDMPHAIAVTSGTAALALAIMAAGVPKGSLIACPGFTFIATPSAIAMAGCVPFLVEVDDDLNFDLEDLKQRWHSGIRAILVVHMRGFASDMPAILHFAETMGVPVFEDAVPALGAELDGRKLGTFGLAAGFSTQSDKSLNCGEGGFVLTHDSDLAARAIALSGAYEGRCSRHFETGVVPCAVDLPLLGLRMDEIRAAMLSSELGRLDERLHDFRRNYAYVSEALADLRQIEIRRPVRQGALLGEAFIFRVPQGDAEWFAHALSREGIDARNLGNDADRNVRVFWNWGFMFAGEATADVKRRLPRTTRLLQQAVDIPLSSTLSLEDCDHLISAVRKVAAASNI